MLTPVYTRPRQMRLSSRGCRSFRRAPREEVPETRLSSDVLTDILSQREGVGLIDGRLYFLDPRAPESRRAFVQFGLRRLGLREGAPLSAHWRARLSLKLTADDGETHAQSTGDQITDFVCSHLEAVAGPV